MAVFAQGLRYVDRLVDANLRAAPALFIVDVVMLTPLAIWLIAIVVRGLRAQRSEHASQRPMVFEVWVVGELLHLGVVTASHSCLN